MLCDIFCICRGVLVKEKFGGRFMAVKVDKDKILSAWIAAEHIVEGDYTNKSIGGRKPVCLHSNKDEKECGV